MFVDVDKIVSCSDDCTIKIWDKTEQTLLTTLEGHTQEVKCLSYYPSPRILASGGHDAAIKIWKPIPSWTNVTTIKSNQRGISALLIASEKILISGALDGTVKVWDFEKSQVIKSHACQEAVHSLLTYQYKQESVLLAGCSKYLYVIQQKTWDIQKIIELHKDAIEKMLLISRRKEAPVIVTCSRDQTMKLLDQQTLSVLRVINIAQKFTSLAFIKDYDLLIAGTARDNSQGRVVLINFDSGQKVRELADIPSQSKQILWDTVNKMAFICYESGEIEANNLITVGN